MAQTGFTPISLYYSATTTNVPLAANLAAGELALNTADGKLFYKNSSNVVTVLATAANAASPLAVVNGGTGVTTSTGTGSVVLSTSPTLVTPLLGTPTSGNFSSGSFTWPTFNQNTSGTAAGLSATLAIASGGTGATSLAGASITTYAGTETLTNKRITPRIISVASASPIIPTGDTADQYEVTALAAAANVNAPTGTPTDGQKLVLRIVDNGTARALTWTTTSGGYRVIGTILPTTTVVSKTLYVGCIYNSAAVFWDVVALAQQV